MNVGSKGFSNQDIPIRVDISLFQFLELSPICGRMTSWGTINARQEYSGIRFFIKKDGGAYLAQTISNALVITFVTQVDDFVGEVLNSQRKHMSLLKRSLLSNRSSYGWGGLLITWTLTYINRSCFI